jgi:hypothetical protein
MTRTLVTIGTLALYFAACTALLPAVAVAQDIVHLPQNRPAPFEGFLLREDDLLRWRQRIELLEHRLTLDIDTERRVAALQMALEQARTRAVEERLALRERLWREQTAALAQELDKARRAAVRGFWETPSLWFAFGLVTAIVSAVVLALT